MNQGPRWVLLKKIKKKRRWKISRYCPFNNAWDHYCTLCDLTFQLTSRQTAPNNCSWHLKIVKISINIFYPCGHLGFKKVFWGTWSQLLVRVSPTMTLLPMRSYSYLPPLRIPLQGHRVESVILAGNRTPDPMDFPAANTGATYVVSQLVAHHYTLRPKYSATFCE